MAEVVETGALPQTQSISTSRAYGMSPSRLCAARDHGSWRARLSACADFGLSPRLRVQDFLLRTACCGGRVVLREVASPSPPFGPDALRQTQNAAFAAHGMPASRASRKGIAEQTNLAADRSKVIRECFQCHSVSA